MKTVLVIEDNVDNMALIGEILEDNDFRVAEAWRAEEGIEWLRHEPTDLILMDVSLPGMDGLEATRIIKSDAHLGMIPLIILTAHAMAADQEAARVAGCDAFATKPIDEGLLMQTVQRLLL